MTKAELIEKMAKEADISKVAAGCWGGDLMKSHKRLYEKQAQKRVFPKSIQTAERLLKHRDRGVNPGRVKAS
jgi:hypothetical protein